MQISSQTIGDFQVITVDEARIDASFAIMFKDKMRLLTEGGSLPVLLDLATVQFIDSSGLGAIVAAMKQLGGARPLHLSGLTPTVAKVFRLTRMDTVFALHKDIDDAIAHAAAR